MTKKEYERPPQENKFRLAFFVTFVLVASEICNAVPPSGIGVASCESYRNSEDEDPTAVSLLLKKKPWIRSCVEINFDQEDQIQDFQLFYREVREELIDIRDLKYLQELEQKIQDHYPGMRLDVLGIALPSSLLMAPVDPLFDYVWEDAFFEYQYWGLVAEGEVYPKHKESETPARITVDSSMLRVAKVKKGEYLSLVKHLQKQFPEYFYCRLRHATVYDYLILEQEKQTDDLSNNNYNVNLRSNLHFWDFTSLLKIKDADGRLFWKKNEVIHLDPKHQRFEVNLNMLRRDGLLSENAAYICGDEEKTEIPSVPVESQVDDCLAQGIEDVIALDACPLSSGFHYNGSSFGQCKFTLAQWHSDRQTIETLFGRFVDSAGATVSVECRNLSIQKGKLSLSQSHCKKFSSEKESR